MQWRKHNHAHSVRAEPAEDYAAREIQTHWIQLGVLFIAGSVTAEALSEAP